MASDSKQGRARSAAQRPCHRIAAVRQSGFAQKVLTRFPLPPRAPHSALATLVGAIAIFAALVPATQAATVSLGDSFSSGEGAAPFDAGTSQESGNGCDRSAKAWPRLLGVPKANHFACSGATTGDFYKASKDPVSQLESLRRVAARESISKVYVTIGGNDLGFSHTIRHCFFENCLKQMDTHELRKLHQVVEPAVAKALSEAKTAAAGGQVVLVGYPDLIPLRARGSSTAAGSPTKRSPASGSWSQNLTRRSPRPRARPASPTSRSVAP